MGKALKRIATRVKSLVLKPWWAKKLLKKEIKAETAALHLKTKETIEELGDAQVYDLWNANGSLL